MTCNHDGTDDADDDADEESARIGDAVINDADGGRVDDDVSVVATSAPDEIMVDATRSAGVGDSAVGSDAGIGVGERS